MAFIAPSLIGLIFFVIQGALYFYGRSVAEQAAREGVSQLRLEQTAADFQSDKVVITHNIEEFANSIGSGVLSDVHAEPNYDSDAGVVTVTVTGTAVSLTGLTLHISQTVTGRIERFQDLS